MGKIICDVCGTTYPDTAERCPICGCTRDEAASMLGDELLMDELITDPKPSQPAKKREIFDFDEANSSASAREKSQQAYGEEEEYDEEPPKQNTALIVLLTALIALLLIAAAFLFFRFYLPGMGEQETVPPMTTAPVVTTVETTEATEPTIPCESLVLLSGTATGDAELTSPGQKFLINVHVSPENTTDKLTFVSADESIATVSEDGQVLAVGEGETVINIVCGKMEMPCKVSCNFTKETEPPTEETTVPTEAETEAPMKDVELKLQKTDIRLKVYLEFRLLLDCDLEQNEVEWSCEHPHIAKVDEEGNVTALKAGTTSVTAKYGDQEVSCMIRCYD